MPAPATEQPGPGPVPRHVAVIMDGNGRWAEQALAAARRGASRWRAHGALDDRAFRAARRRRL